MFIKLKRNVLYTLTFPDGSQLYINKKLDLLSTTNNRFIFSIKGVKTFSGAGTTVIIV